ncbi:DUF3489 domain-containing protein [Enterovirga sp. CN4-39]|uniref:DUF3489 domain-containing protein n=1 Tax=Enterovirga sp. CN4-39 TaxID=3400910 RepID=UPI003C12B02D
MITLSKTETAILVEAAGRGGALEFPEATKPTTRQRLLGRFERDGLIRVGDGGHALTPAGYRAVGLRPPRQKRVNGETDATPRPATKQTMILDLLRRGEGASIGELMDATGWLPHTTRAALSRLRSAGTALTRSTRADGTGTYRIAVTAGPIEAEPEQADAETPSAATTKTRSRRRRGRGVADSVQAVAG